MPLEKRSVFTPNASPILLALVLALGSGADTRAQVNQCDEPPNPPGDASLRILMKDGQTVFREGEIIALTAEYSADTSDKYLLNNRNYDRSGRVSGEDVFCIEPDRGSDPLDDYYHSFQGFIGGGIFSEEDPALDPLIVNIELNEWKSLPPGSYKLTIVGNRLSLGKQGDAASWHNTAIPLRSNTVEFQIEPADSDWQASQLAAATQTLNSPSASQEDSKHAARLLRFLGSEGSTLALAHRYGAVDDPFEWEFKFGLYSTPHRDLAIQAMKVELSNPDHPVTREYVSTLVALEMLSDPKLRLPPFDANHKEEWSRASEAHFIDFDRRVNAYLQQASAAPRDAAALATTASEMLQSGLPMSPGKKAHWRQALISNWNTVPVEKQNQLIESRWEDVRGPEWLSILEQIVAGPPNPRRAINEPNRETALLRILEVESTAAHDLILREIAKPQGDISISVLGRLSERSLPQFETAWIDAIRRGDSGDIFFQLIGRYGSEHSLPALQSIYEARRGEWACAPQTAMLRYFLRVKPDYGLQELTAAMASRKSTGCYRWQLSELREYANAPQVQKLAIQLLDDPAPSVASDAAKVLQQYGSSQAEKALFLRLEKFHEQWKDKPDELLHPSQKPVVFDSESGLEQTLVQAIENGQAWFADATTIRRLKDLSSPAMQNSLDDALDILSKGEFTVDMNWWTTDELKYTLGWYSGDGMSSFKEKLAQFPSGSHFRLMTTKAQQDAHQAEFSEAQRTAAENGETLEILAPR